LRLESLVYRIDSIRFDSMCAHRLSRTAPPSFGISRRGKKPDVIQNCFCVEDLAEEKSLAVYVCDTLIFCILRYFLPIYLLYIYTTLFTHSAGSKKTTIIIINVISPNKKQTGARTYVSKQLVHKSK